MTSKTLTLHLPDFYNRAREADQAPLSMLRAALVVGEHIVQNCCRYEPGSDSLRETAQLLRSKIQELLCFLDVYEQKLANRPVQGNASNDDNIDF